MARRAFVLALGTGALAVLGHACLEPTQVRVKLTTDVCDLEKLEIALESESGWVTVAEQRLTSPCSGIGDLVFVPSKRGPRFTVRARALQPNGDCDQEPKVGCVEASRTIAFQPRRAIEMPIALTSRCLNVSCEFGATCVEGRCVSDEVTPPEDGGSVDPTVDDAGDAATECVFTNARSLPHKTVIARYSFSENVGTSTVINGKDATKYPLPASFTRVPSEPSCSKAIMPGASGTLALSPASMTALNFTVFVRPESRARYTLFATSGWTLALTPSMVQSEGLNLEMTSTISGGSITTKSHVAVDGQFHLIEVAQNASGAIELSVDALIPEKFTLKILPGASFAIPASSKPISFDELRVYEGP